MHKLFCIPSIFLPPLNTFLVPLFCHLNYSNVSPPDKQMCHETRALTQLATNNLPKCVSRPSSPLQTRPKCYCMVSPLRGRQTFRAEVIGMLTHAVFAHTQRLWGGGLKSLNYIKRREVCLSNCGIFLIHIQWQVERQETRELCTKLIYKCR